MKKQVKQHTFDTQQEIDYLWALRVVVNCRLYNKFIREDDFKNDDVAFFLGLVDQANYGKNHNDKPTVIRNLNSLLVTYEKLSKSLKPSKVLTDNVQDISNLINLSDIEQKILTFVIVLSTSNVLEAVTDLAGELTLNDACELISVALNISPKEIKDALAPNAILTSSGLITIYKRGKCRLVSKIECINNNFVEKITTLKTEPSELIKESVKCCEKAKLSIRNYYHIKTIQSKTLLYLKESIVQDRKGANILIYGKPGTGKTEFAKVLAKSLKKELFEISYCDEDDEPIEGFARLRAFKMAQSFLKNKKPILMFDESEDVFNSDSMSDYYGFLGKKSRQSHKAWINRQLEENKIPTIWITNDIGSIDDAIIRRFDIVFEMPIPPKEERIKIAKKASKSLLDDKSLQIIGENKHIAPAIITKSIEVASMITKEKTKTEFSKQVISLIEETLKAQGYGELNIPKKQKEDYYDANLSNCNFDLNNLKDGLKKSQEGRICLFGPPGTGKTAFGKWLAKELGKPLIVKRASDLLGKYVGENEKNIADAFNEAKQKNGVLLFDEVDSFLNDRTNAVRSWEITSVNEMLTQMESFEGIFIASTNLMGNIDSAAIRRFDAKIEFGYMTSAQTENLFDQSVKRLGLVGDTIWIKKASNLTQLTPGDFAAVTRRNKFAPIESAQELYEKLKYECAMKKDSKSKQIGFAS